ncbi:rhodanese-like domain-containing protein [Paenibacillus odorifer]|uniref:Sulfurtransferase n=1 Tax=Paenibacillus odorifer TaxID=189426 RepID=A0A1R0XI01_9BACL|nr:rhodanese-like domain-containing protein [Paenibacillus odorifer]OMD34734.1 sulfurtransferase [Paenibacillus odorifer]
MTFKEITSTELAKRLDQGESLSILDVRELDEWEEGHVAGAKHIPLGELNLRLNELDPARETIVICRSGNRSGMACELLNAKGFKVINMTGGLLAWTDKLVRE